ncbi:hypothetical protein AA309_22725 [Microvirga vignae]|uniref:Uncharacterized protein n=1 Tax=Microvirga vignae TaxID=1225564 RepID=A0A0H1R832_9HYPH|nr:hypothetical protein [Microvirga vignae]KLK90996.1 hypothetical protein AA309_22725 [Microvirga vignae]
MQLDSNHLTALEQIRLGIETSKQLMVFQTEYHGGPVQTEYILTTDAARSLAEIFSTDVAVECPYKDLVNLLNAQQVKKSVFRGTRADITVKDSLNPPIAVIEFKIRVRRFADIQGDISKISRLLTAFKPQICDRTLGIVAFQVHVPARENWITEDRVLAKAKAVESNLKAALGTYAAQHPGFMFDWHEFQGADEGAVGRQLDGHPDDPDAAWGKKGHATRYHAVLIQRIRSVPATQPSPFKKPI